MLLLLKLHSFDMVTLVDNNHVGGEIDNKKCYDGVEEDITFAIDEMDVFHPLAHNIYTTHVGWSPKSVVAEVCLCLSKRISPSHNKWAVLVKKGWCFAKEAEHATIEKQASIAGKINKSVLEELDSLIQAHGMEFPQLNLEKGARAEIPSLLSLTFTPPGQPKRFSTTSTSH